MPRPATLFDKVWNDHVVVRETAETPAVLYIDLHLIHEVTTPQAFALLRDLGLPVRRPDLTLATMDHSTPTTRVSSFKELTIAVGDSAAKQVVQLEENCERFGVELLGRLPLAASIRQQADSGNPTVAADPDSDTAEAFRSAARRMAAALAMKGKDYSAKFPKIVVE